MEDAEKMTPSQIANHTFAYLRRLETQLFQVSEILLKHEAHVARLDRDLGEIRRDLGEIRRDISEVRSDGILHENQMLNRMNEILSVVRRLDDHNTRISALETPLPAQ
jgi:chromosome segregation ATPase